MPADPDRRAERTLAGRSGECPRARCLEAQQLAIESDREATGSSVCLSFAADGLPPLPARPFLVGDFVDRYRREDDGRWRIAERRIERVFTSD